MCQESSFFYTLTVNNTVLILTRIVLFIKVYGSGHREYQYIMVYFSYPIIEQIMEIIRSQESPKWHDLKARLMNSIGSTGFAEFTRVLSGSAQ